MELLYKYEFSPKRQKRKAHKHLHLLSLNNASTTPKKKVKES